MLTDIPKTGIDWDFLDKREGGQQLWGYVPTHDGDNKDKSGVTIATGFDLGQHNLDDLKKMGLSNTLIKKLYLYLGFRDEDAWGYLQKFPLKITKEEADQIDEAMKVKVVMRLARDFRLRTGEAFTLLPPQVQTVLFSLAWNFGEALPLNLPDTYGKFLKSWESGDWSTFQTQLANFPSKNPELRKRRLKEAEYLLPLCRTTLIDPD